MSNIQASVVEVEDAMEHLEPSLEKASEAGKPQVEGLCSTCNHAPDCVLVAQPGRPVIQCEEFDDRPLGPPAPELRSIQPAIVLADEAAALEPEPELKGLCVDCEERRTCMHALRRGGVWHCEEYH